jgi:hypothetical protein
MQRKVLHKEICHEVEGRVGRDVRGDQSFAVAVRADVCGTGCYTSGNAGSAGH